MSAIKRKYKWTAASLLLLVIVPILSQSFWNWLENADYSAFHHLRGPRSCSDKVALVFIDSQDVEELGWPVTRDYYGYAVHALKEAGARVIAIDVLFDTPNKRYPEYDQDLVHFARIAANVSIPFAFQDFSNYITRDNLTLKMGAGAQLPFTALRQQIAGSGFSNLEEETVVRRALITAASNDSLSLAFGLECARQFLFGDSSSVTVAQKQLRIDGAENSLVIRTDKKHRILLNHFGDLSRVHTMSLIDMFQTFQRAPQELQLEGKLVFVGVTAPGVSPVKVTPLNPSFPATLVQLTLAENIISDNYIRPAGIVAGIIIPLLFIAGVFLVFHEEWPLWWLALAGLIYATCALLAFSLGHRMLPFYHPLFVAFVSTAAMLGLRYIEQRQEVDESATHSAQIAIELTKALAEQDRLRAELSDVKKISTEKVAQARKQIEQFEMEIQRLRDDLTATPAPLQRSAQDKLFPHIIRADDSPMNAILELAAKVAPADLTVLISGETGTGKEVVARAIHEASQRKQRSFIAVNCGALSETLLESELFGHEKGAFTGASAQRLGRFELADGGTLFLDEITETSANFQAKLLRALQEGTFERLGGERTIRVDVRIIAASSKNLEEQVRTQKFRQDLYYRLNGFPIHLPPLRQRQQDILPLAGHFLEKYNYQDLSFTRAAESLLRDYSWPGNVRELENSLRRAALLAQSDGRQLIQEVDLADLKETAQTLDYKSFDEQVIESLRAYKFSHSSISQTAKLLGNKDRGTITDYFRGICYENLVAANFDIDAAVHHIAASDDPVVLERVQKKLENYLRATRSSSRSALIKGLPKRYHQFVDQIIQQNSDRTG